MSEPQKKSWKEHYWHGVPVMKKRIESIIEVIQPEGKSIVEVGCNEGFVSKALSENGGKVTSVDYDPAECAKAKKIFGIDVIQANINNLPFEDNSYDVACGCEVLEHIDNPMVGLQELFRVAREQVVITIPVGEYWLGELTHMWGLSGSFIHHDTVQEYKAIKDILILSWKRKRDKDFKDIPPFNTEKLKLKHGIK